MIVACFSLIILVLILTLSKNMEDEKGIVTCVSGDKGASSPYSIFSSDNHGALITSVQLKVTITMSGQRR